MFHLMSGHSRRSIAWLSKTSIKFENCDLQTGHINDFIVFSNVCEQRFTNESQMVLLHATC